MLKSRQIVFDKFLRFVEAEPIRERIASYRALADIIGTVPESRRLNQLADDMESADRRCREFHFQFTQGKAKQ